MKRNSCRTPWDKVVNLSARQTLPTVQGKNFILQLDIFNFLNLLNKNWGSRDFGSTNSPALLTRRSYVAAPGQPVKITSGAQPVFNYNVVNQFNTQNASVELRAAAPAQVSVLKIARCQRRQTGAPPAPPFLRSCAVSVQRSTVYRSSLNPGITSGRCAAFATIHPVAYIHCVIRASFGMSIRDGSSRGV